MSPTSRGRTSAPRPNSPDGRAYPSHLRVYEQLDATLLPLLETMEPVTFDRLSSAVSDARARAVLPRWLASAEWRGLVDRSKQRGVKPGSYRLAESPSLNVRRQQSS